MWRELITSAYPDYTLYNPIRAQEIYFVQRALDVEFPAVLTALLQELNGGRDSDGQCVLWDIARIEKGNQELRQSTAHMPVHHLLFFAEDASRNLYAFPIIKKAVKQDRVYVWRRDDDSRICVASTLAEFLQQWLTGNVVV